MLSAAALGFTLSAISLMLGAVAAFGLRNYQSSLPGIIVLTSGVLISQVIMRLLPESIDIGGWVATLLGLVTGCWLLNSVKRMSSRVIVISPYSHSIPRGTRTAVTISLAIASHNFPVGLALGGTLANEDQLLPTVGSTLLLHSLPEGIIMGLLFVAAGISLTAMVLCISFASFPAALGSLLGYHFTTISAPAFSVVLGLAIGTIMFVVIKEMIQPVWQTRRTATVTYAAIGGAIGIIPHVIS